MIQPRTPEDIQAEIIRLNNEFQETGASAVKWTADILSRVLAGEQLVRHDGGWDDNPLRMIEDAALDWLDGYDVPIIKPECTATTRDGRVIEMFEGHCPNRYDTLWPVACKGVILGSVRLSIEDLSWRPVSPTGEVGDEVYGGMQQEVISVLLGEEVELINTPDQEY